MEFFAHKRDDNKKQTIKEHLENTAKLSEGFCVDFLKPIAYSAGVFHDVGKYSEAFQKRLNGENIRFEHSSCGAIEVGEKIKNREDLLSGLMLEYCIAGHHTGLPDGGNKYDSPYDDVTLHSRMKRKSNYTGQKDYSAYSEEISVLIPDSRGLNNEIKNSSDKFDMLEKYAFFTRYIFSCLTDADFLDTENFCNPDTNRELKADFVEAEKELDKKLGSFKCYTPLQKARSRLQNQAFSNADKQAEISMLNMPTGSGKTLCSIKIGFKKLLESKGRKKRIIYVIPYTSIIEQTAEVYEKIFGKYVDVLEHHWNYCFDKTENSDTIEKLKKATENWDAPLVITTAVQFFQSLYHYKGSGLRKLHNTADSIIIFDEIHLLPTKYLQPCLKGIGFITKYLNSEAVFLSATMPDYSKLFEDFIPDCKVNNLITDKSDFELFKKCSYTNLGKTDYESIIEKTDKYTSSLIIVNTRSSAREIYSLISGKKFHLSTYMTPMERSETIKEINACLKNNEKITVVSTSLVEAGVDFDFEAVFRQLAGLDSILQSGGRCNREGMRETGEVYIFETDDKPDSELQAKVNITRELCNSFEDISCDECIAEYYRRVFKLKENEINSNTIAEISTGIDSIPFRKYAEDFRFIKDDTIGIVINNCEKTEELLNRLKSGDYSAKRKLQRYTVGLKIYEFEQAVKLGIVEDSGAGVFVLTNSQYYNKETGFDVNKENDIIF